MKRMMTSNMKMKVWQHVDAGQPGSSFFLQTRVSLVGHDAWP